MSLGAEIQNDYAYEIYKSTEEIPMNVNPCFVVTGKVRLSYTHLFQPYANRNGGEAKYSTTILVPKSDTATKQRIDAAIAAAKQAGASKCWNGDIPPIVAVPVYDGDGARPSDGMPFGDECKGHWVFTASSKQPPQVVDPQVQPIIDQSQVYSGMYGRVSVTFFPYNSNGKKGIGCGLNNVQKLKDGEPLGGRTTAADDFSAMPVYMQQPASPAAVPQYQQPAAPAAYAIDPITGQPMPLPL